MMEWEARLGQQAHWEALQRAAITKFSNWALRSLSRLSPVTKAKYQFMTTNMGVYARVTN